MYTPTETGHWVSENFMRLAEVIQDYDYNFELRWIPPENRTTPHEHQNPYCIFHLGENRVIKHIPENANPEEVLANLFESDMRHGNVLQRIEAKERAHQIIQAKEKMDLAEERQEMAAWFVNNAEHGKNYIKHNGRKLDDQLRPVD